ncbi:hypothetical protein [Streptomyces sp. MP131-18]|uniref:hypothetical protein n=1 Tax=Streptomyces sp. MP131-18 TaxID=1857892 RepID=UPI00097BBA9E|nr:hypothetical protein [Streptomyces sp. MP131-18]ONK14871.1 hypothetical protein STBA_56630 [Streptomyces sp. MP131-18]
MGILPVVLLLGACGEESADSGAPPAGDSSPEPPADGGGQDGAQYQVSGAVLQSGDGEPMLCSGLMESMPPQCGTGLPVEGWDWNAVESESAADTTWGHYVVTGTWDGERFTLTEPPETEAPDGVAPAPEEPEVPPADRSPEELAEVQQSLMAEYPDDVLSAHVDEESRVVRADVVADTPELRQSLAEDFGEGTVVPEGWLRPVTDGG